MTPTPHDISVIICAYTHDRWDDLIAAVASVQQQLLSPKEIIVVIDHNPGLMERVREHMSGVVVAENTQAPGLSGTRNSGIAVAKSEIIAFLDDDAVATPDWLLLLCEGFTDSQVLGSGGAVTPLWLDKPPAWLPEEFYWVVGCSYRGMPQTVQTIRNPIGANMAFRREVFDTVGGFRSGIGRVGTRPAGCEETELCIRARQHWPQRTFLYQPRAKVFHRVPDKRTSWRYFYSRCYAEGLSKAVVTQYVGAKDSLASERSYTLRTLPHGVVRNVTHALLHHEFTGLARAAAIALGLSVTTTGYLIGSIFSTQKKIPILMYHSIAEDVTVQYKPFAVSPSLFAQHMEYLHLQGYTPMTVTQVVQAVSQRNVPDRPVVLTFDDGFADFFTEALPVLQQYNFTATLYVATGFIGSTSRWLQREGEATRPMLTWDQLREISACGIECGGHSHWHPQLDTLPLAAARDEIVNCKQLLEDHLGQQVSTFAYPHGYHSTAIKRLVREAGYTSACAVGYAMSSATTDPFALVRLRMGADTSVDALGALLTQRIPSVLTTLYKRVRTSGWRLVRRYLASVTGHLQGKLDTHILPGKADVAQVSAFAPARIVEIEIGQPLPTIAARDGKTDEHYQRAICLVRLHTQPLGLVELELDEHGVSADECATHIWRALGEKINEHLQQDGLPPVTELSALGVACRGEAACLEEREQFLAHAPFVSVIVPTHDRPERIQVCLPLLLALHYPQYEIIVVDNAPSTSATADFIQQTYHAMPQVRYVREDHPGSSWARNRGMLVAKGDLLAFADDDVVIDPYWLVELVRAFSLADDVACVTGLVLPIELETQAQHWLEEYGGFSKEFTQRIFDMKEHHPNSPLYPYTAGRLGTGANMAFTAAFLRSVGGFDPALGAASPAHGGEDLAAFFQVITQGYKLVYVPTALVYHPHRRDYGALRKQIYQYGIGLVAYLTKSVFDAPRLLFDLIPKLPYSLFFILSGQSPKNSKKSKNYPQELTMLELKGMLYGPFAYMQSLWAVRNARKGGC